MDTTSVDFICPKCEKIGFLNCKKWWNNNGKGIFSFEFIRDNHKHEYDPIETWIYDEEDYHETRGSTK